MRAAIRCASWIVAVRGSCKMRAAMWTTSGYGFCFSVIIISYIWFLNLPHTQHIANCWFLRESIHVALAADGVRFRSYGANPPYRDGCDRSLTWGSLKYC